VSHPIRLPLQKANMSKRSVVLQLPLLQDPTCEAMLVLLKVQSINKTAMIRMMMDHQTPVLPVLFLEDTMLRMSKTMKIPVRSWATCWR
jgi:hypothetical protein